MLTMTRLAASLALALLAAVMGLTMEFRRLGQLHLTPSGDRPDERFGPIREACGGATSAVYFTDKPPDEANSSAYFAQYALAPLLLEIVPYEAGASGNTTYRGLIVCDLDNVQRLEAFLSDPRNELLKRAGPGIALVKRQ
jgi:hypothetical protein